MTDFKNIAIDLRDAVRGLLADLDSVEERQLWVALTRQERIRAISYAVRHGHSPETRKALIRRVAKALKWRPQKVEERIEELAIQVERATGVLDGFESYLLFALWTETGIWTIFADFCASSETAAGHADRDTPDFTRIEPAVHQALEIADVNTVILFLIAFAGREDLWRKELHNWLSSLHVGTLSIPLASSVVVTHAEPLMLIDAENVSPHEPLVFPSANDSLMPDLSRIAALEARWDRLRSQFDDLSSWMETVSAEMRELSTPPPSELARRIDAVIDTFERLRDSVSAERHTILGDGGLNVDMPSLVRVGSVLQECRSEAQRMQQRSGALQEAQRIVHLCARLTSPHSSLASALAACRKAASDLLVDFADPAMDRAGVVAQLQTGRHPFALLTKRVAEGELSVEDDMLLDSWLRENFGPALAIAVLSGRVEFGPEVLEDRMPQSVSTFGDATKEETLPAPRTLQDEKEIDTHPTDLKGVLRGVDGSALSVGGAPMANPAEAGPPTDTGTVDGPAGADLTGDPPVSTIGISSADSHPGPRRELDHPEDEIGYNAVLRTESEPGSEIWDLLREGDAAIAYHLSRVLEISPIPPLALQALVLGREIRTALGEIAQALIVPFEWLGNEYLSKESEVQKPVHLLIAAAALRPALIAPATGGGAVLRQLRLEGDLYGLVQAVAAYGERLNGLDPAALGGALSLAQWQEAQNQLQSEVRQYLEHAGRRTILYSRATDVWANWTREDGLIQQLLKPILLDDAGALDQTVARIHAIDIEREVNRTDKALRAGKREPIHARALEQFRRYFDEAAEFVWQWRDVQSLRPKSDHYQQTAIEELRHEFQTRYPRVEKQLREVSRKRGVEFSAGAVLLQKAVSDLRALLINGTGLGAGEPSPVHLLNSILLRTDLPLARGLEPRERPERIEDAIHRFTQERPSWQAAFQTRISLRDFEGARRLVEFLQHSHHDSAAELLSQWNQDVASGLHTLTHDLTRTRHLLEEHVSKGLVREGDRSAYDAILVEVSRQVSLLRKADGRTQLGLAAEHYGFSVHHGRLREVRSALAQLKRDRTDGILSRLERSELPTETAERIRMVLERGDFLTAEEYIDLGESKQLPPDPEEIRDEFREFFPGAAHHLERYLDEFAPPLVVQHLRERLPIPGLRVERLDLDQARQASELMTVWYEMKRQHDFQAEQVMKLVAGIGFRPIKVDAIARGHVPQVKVQAQPIADRTEIPVEFFGSRAQGEYRLLGIWERRSEEEIAGIVGESHGESPTIVCFFGRLSEQQRCGLGQLSRRLRRTFVVLDETLLLFLCGESGSKLPIFFRCALPFTHLDPYITTGSLVPPEMFFGREREREQIVDPYGPSVLYGGRQLGKTALLRHVKRMYHNPERGWIVRWIDLRAEGVGHYRGTEEIWPTLVNEMVRFEILPSRIPPTTGPERLIERIHEWLREETGRRIVLLLDEADRFLERDAKDDFRQTALLKKLMDQTGRAFKVVFAGLHNVFRTFNDPNHPIGHFGSPIQIGPLIDNGEVRSARALIAEPFSLIGYRFESADLVSRILAETNYYPSLLQLYGSHLLKHLLERQAASGRPFSPPVVITHGHVDDASRGHDLRESIHQRFALTLQLDPRYEVIAYALAHAILEHSLSLEQGATADWIRRDALYWWPEGFEATSGPELRVLLDELVGLGVLRSVGGNYTFRNANVLLLMGTEEEIRTALLRDRLAPPTYEAASFREIIRTDFVRMSPLTAQQLGMLYQPTNGVNILIGSEANDLGFVPEFLTRRFGREFVHKVEGLSNHRDFVRWLGEIRQEQVRHGTTIVVVGPELPWTRQWIDSAEEWLSKRRSRELGLRVLFVADPRAALRLPDVLTRDSSRSDVRVLELTPWHDSALNQWLDASNITNSPAVRQRIAEVTGNRPYLLYRYLERFNQTFTWEQPLNDLEDELKSGSLKTDAMEALGLEARSSRQAQVLSTMAALGEPVDVHDLALLLEDGDEGEDLASVLHWAEHLQLVRRGAADAWVLDPFVQRLLLGLAI